MFSKNIQRHEFGWKRLLSNVWKSIKRLRLRKVCSCLFILYSSIPPKNQTIRLLFAFRFIQEFASVSFSYIGQSKHSLVHIDIHSYNNIFGETVASEYFVCIFLGMSRREFCENFLFAHSKVDKQLDSFCCSNTSNIALLDLYHLNQQTNFFPFSLSLFFSLSKIPY